MKSAIALAFVFLSVSFAQINRETVLKFLENRNDLKITSDYKAEGKDIYKIEYSNGGITLKNLNVKERKFSSVGTTTVNIWEIDTALYLSMYTPWQEVLSCNNSTEQLVIGDLNNNGRKEIYGYTKDYDELLGEEPIKIYELDSTYKFKYKYSYSDSVKIVKAIYNIKNDGIQKLYLCSEVGNGIVYIAPTLNSFPTLTDFVFYRYTNRRQMNDVTFGDFDKNGKTDMLYFELFELKSYIFEYNPAINNFVFVDSLPPYFAHCEGYAVGDFDTDGKTDLVYGGVHGEVYMVEADSEHTYNTVWMDTADTYNAWMHMATNDLDKNGKPEFWVGGAAFYDPNPPITRFTCFETIGDNQYREVHRIDIVGIFSFYAGNCFPLDVDKDGVEELVICLDQHVFIFKFIGKPNKQSYKLFYVKRNNNPRGVFYGVTMNDLTNSGYEEMLIHQDNIRQDGKGKHFTAVFKPNFISYCDIFSTQFISGFELKQNYPNPFNPNTTLSYLIPELSYITLKVFDLLGNEVTLLEEGIKEAGKYLVKWNGKDKFKKEISTGVYLIRLETPLYSRTIKCILIK